MSKYGPILYKNPAQYSNMVVSQCGTKSVNDTEENPETTRVSACTTCNPILLT